MSTFRYLTQEPTYSHRVDPATLVAEVTFTPAEIRRLTDVVHAAANLAGYSGPLERLYGRLVNVANAQYERREAAHEAALVIDRERDDAEGIDTQFGTLPCGCVDQQDHDDRVIVNMHRPLGEAQHESHDLAAYED